MAAGERAVTEETGEAGWRETNRRMWDERVAVHLAPGGYDLTGLRAGSAMLGRIEEREIGEFVGGVEGLRIVHLQCHFGKDSLTLAQQGAKVVGLDFSHAAIAAARALAEELGLAERARFVEGDLYDAPRLVDELEAFDLAFVTWGAIGWLPDIFGWARIVAGLLKPGGRLYLAEGHPAAFVFDDAAVSEGGQPGWFVPYFERGPHVFEAAEDYANPEAPLKHTKSVGWMHPLADTVSALLEAGLRLRMLREHDAVPWRMFRSLRQDADGLYRWPDRRWLPLAFSLLAEKPS
jgi:SAM-dependent methyltransferase